MRRPGRQGQGAAAGRAGLKTGRAADCGREKDRSCRRKKRASGYRSACRRMQKIQAGRLAGESSPRMQTQVGRSGDPAIRRSGDPAIRRSGDPAIRRSGDPAIRRSGDPAIRLILGTSIPLVNPRLQTSFTTAASTVHTHRFQLIVNPSRYKKTPTSTGRMTRIQCIVSTAQGEGKIFLAWNPPL